MRVFKPKGSKSYRVRYSINRRQFDEPLMTRIKEVAMVKARTLVREREEEAAGMIEPRLLRETAKTPLPEVLEMWLCEWFAFNANHKHRKNSKNRTLRLFEECNWKYLPDVNARSFEAWRMMQLQAGLKPKTLNEYLGHVRCFLNWLEGREMIKGNPLKIVIPLPVILDAETRAFPHEDLMRLIEVSPPYRACTYTVAAFTGLRRSELQDLEWTRVHLDGENSFIRLDPAKTKNRKGGTLPIHPDAVTAFESLKAQALSSRLRLKRKGLVFYRGIPKMPRFLEDLKAAGIPEFDKQGRRIEFHGLRKTLATFLNSAGVAPRIAMELMRHSDIRLTMQTYTDSSLLPLAAAFKETPSVKSSLESSLSGGKTCPKVSFSGKKGAFEEVSENSVSPLNTGGSVSEMMAEGVGFEPTEPCGSAVFKTAAIDHSATPPDLDAT